MSRILLREWTAKHMPALHAELSPLSHDAARIRLNEITGLSIQRTELIESSSAKFLAALKAMQEKR